MKQYWELKEQAGDALLLFRMGDFYELFGPDAVEAARLLEITLTSRDKGKENPLPMAGVPHHSVAGYLQRLLRAGKKVAIAEQFEESDPSGKPGKTIVRRAIVRLLTPAIQFDSESPQAAYLATATEDGGADATVSLALLDVATGETRFTSGLALEEAQGLVSSLPIRHWIDWEGRTPRSLSDALRRLSTAEDARLVETLPSNSLTDTQAERILTEQFGVRSFETFVPEAEARLALALLVQYALRSQRAERLPHLQLPLPIREARALRLGAQTPAHLDLVPDLLTEIDRTGSALGARTLRRWLLSPLAEVGAIAERQDAVRELATRDRPREALRGRLKEAYDLERLAARLTTRLANPRDTLALGRTLAALPSYCETLASMKSSALQSLARELADVAPTLAPLGERILREQRDDAPLVVRDGGIFREGVSPELDRLLKLAQDGSQFLVALEARERERTGISSLKVRYNRVFGYYIEITQAHLKSVPADYQRKQTTVGAERFFTEELKKFEDEIVTASDRQKAMESELFARLLADALSVVPEVMRAARALGEIDALQSMAELASRPGWSFPDIDETLELDIRGGRHPLVDSPAGRAAGRSFVPNDTLLGDSSARALLITGPNMGGKSTLMRQVALIVILGQTGAPVPATSARWGVFSSVYTRIGAHDAIARGQSTFMVEMSELAYLLHRADERSLVVLDEIGRGTSTYDGLSVAWAALEWIATRTRCRTLFATHYHELTRLAESTPGLSNAHLSVEAKAGKLRFLYRLAPGPANESFGVYVAEMAGLPKAVTERAWAILGELEKHQDDTRVTLAPGAPQENAASLPLFSYAAHEPAEAAPEPEPQRDPLWLTELRGLRVEEMTPLQALNHLAEIKKHLNSV